LIPTSLQDKVSARHPALQTLADRVSSRINSFGPEQFVFLEQLWDRVVAEANTSFPGLATIVADLADDIVAISLASADRAFLMGDPTCSGTLTERLHSGRPECSEALLVRYGAYIVREIISAKPEDDFTNTFSGQCCSAAGATSELTLEDLNMVMADGDMMELAATCQAECTVDCNCAGFDLVRDVGNQDSTCRFFTTMPLSGAVLPFSVGGNACYGCFVRHEAGDLANYCVSQANTPTTSTTATTTTTTHTSTGPAAVDRRDRRRDTEPDAVPDAADPAPHSRRRRATIDSDRQDWSTMTTHYDEAGHATGLLTPDNQADYRVRQQLVIPFRFSNHATRSVPTRNVIDKIFNARRGTHASPYTAGSVRDFYNENSYHRTDIVSTVLDWVTIDQTEAFTANGQSAFSGAGLGTLCRALTVALQAAVDANPGIDYRKFKLWEESGALSNSVYEIYFVHSGYVVHPASLISSFVWTSIHLLASFTQQPCWCVRGVLALIHSVWGRAIDWLFTGTQLSSQMVTLPTGSGRTRTTLFHRSAPKTTKIGSSAAQVAGHAMAPILPSLGTW
jgi:hypothetical protein